MGPFGKSIAVWKPLSMHIQLGGKNIRTPAYAGLTFSAHNLGLAAHGYAVQVGLVRYIHYVGARLHYVHELKSTGLVLGIPTHSCYSTRHGAIEALQ